jgi:hypothetical protein
MPNNDEAWKNADRLYAGCFSRPRRQDKHEIFVFRALLCQAFCSLTFGENFLDMFGSDGEIVEEVVQTPGR